MKQHSARTRSNVWLVPVAIVLATLAAYIPVMRGGWIWDDDYYVTRNATLRSVDGLRRIWFEIGAVPQYYPLTHTSFWLEYRLWGLHPSGYHVTNVLLHATSAVLLWILLRRLNVPGAWLAAAVFALHPVHVESVAWVTERKNVLSGVLYLASLLAYLRFAPPDEEPSARRRRDRWRWYALSLILFVCALLGKTVTSSLPAAVLVIVWWKRGRLRWGDVVPLLPFFALGIAGGALTSWMERNVVGAQGPEFAFTWVERCLIAGRAVWFYVRKLLWPHPLIFMYPRWSIDAHAAWQYAFPAASASTILALWFLRHRIGRGPLAAALLFVGTLLPALGFVNVLPMRYSFVADHFQYLASIALIALLAAALARWLPRAVLRGVAVVIVLALAVLTWRRGYAFADAEALWVDTIAKNPFSWMARNNYGALLMNEGRFAEADREFRRTIELNPSHPEARLNLGLLAEREGRLADAEVMYREALSLRPTYAGAHYNLGRLCAQQDRVDEAIRHYREAIANDPTAGSARLNLANIYLNRGDVDAAVAEWSELLRREPENAQALNNVGIVRASQGRRDEAEALFRRALVSDPGSADAMTNLGIMLAQRGDVEAASELFTRALRVRPGHPKAQEQLDLIRERGSVAR